MDRRAVRPHFDPLDGRGTAVQIVRDAPPKPPIEMSPVEQPQAELDVAQPSLLAGPGSTREVPRIVGLAGGQSPVDQTARHHVLPHGHRGTDPGTAAHQVGLGPLEDDYVMASPMQEGRCHTSGD